MAGRKRKTYEQQSVLAWAREDETYAEAERRLDDLWKRGEHPVQLREKQREES